MAIKTFYLVDAVAPGSSAGTLSETIPPSSTTSTGWGAFEAFTGVPGDTLMVYGAFGNIALTTQNTLPAAALAANASDCWRTENVYSGTFAAGNWDKFINIKRSSSLNGISTWSMAPAFRLWKGVSANGSDATQITAARVSLSNSLITVGAAGSNVTGPVTALGAITLSGEYLFLQMAAKMNVNQGSPNDTIGNVNIQVGSARSRLIGTDFAGPSATISISIDAAASNHPCSDTFLISRADFAALANSVNPRVSLQAPDVISYDTGFRRVIVMGSPHITVGNILSS